MKPKWVKKIEDLPPHYTPIEELRANYPQIVKEVEEKYGPPLTPRGRPKRGSIIEKSRMRSIRMKDALWEAIKEHAKAAGLTPNAAMQLAALEWLEKH